MESSTVSSKYQIVIPKALRRKLSIHPGQKVYLTTNKAGILTVDTTSQVDKLYGSMKGVFDEDFDEYLAESRAEANRDRS